MIYQSFSIPKYRWNVQVYYYKTQYYTREIIDNLKIIGCTQDCLKDARENLARGTFNSGLCYSNAEARETIIVIAKTTSHEQFANSWFHEARHLATHIEQELGIDHESEEAAYLSGFIGQKMFSHAKKFLCKCHS